jgi:hypothetical protein
MEWGHFAGGVVYFTTITVLYKRPVHTMPHEVDLCTIEIPKVGVANVTHTWYRHTVIGLHISGLVVPVALPDTFNTTTATVSVTVTVTATTGNVMWMNHKNMRKKNRLRFGNLTDFYGTCTRF